MVALTPRTVMFGNPPGPGYEPSKQDLADWMTEIESLAAGGGLSYVNGSLADLNLRANVTVGQFALVLNGDAEAGIYERIGGGWTKVADVPAVFVESQTAVQVLAARDEVTAAALSVALNASTALAAAEASGLARFFDTKAAADAGLAGLANEQLIEVLSDETQTGLRARYRVVGGALQLKLVIGGMRADQNLADLPDKDVALNNLGLTAVGQALAKASSVASARTALDLKAGALAALATQAQAEAGVENGRYMTPLRTKQAIDASAVALFSTVTDVTASRAKSTTYTNSTGKPMMVVVSLTAGNSVGASFTVDGVDYPSTFTGNNVPSNLLITGMVPAGADYSVASAAGLVKWIEAN